LLTHVFRADNLTAPIAANDDRSGNEIVTEIDGASARSVPAEHI